MATTTNFGWETPDDTDLVKDGAAAMRTLGNSIDTSFVDLKGGTTGQVLSKASNTDLDFTWATDATGIPATIFDAKGDIIAATAADTASRLAVGTNGHVLTADSTAATGLKWAAPDTFNPNFQLINAGGTALTGSTVVTVSGITNKKALWIFVDAASSANTGSTIHLRFNTDTGVNYTGIGRYFTSTSAQDGEYSGYFADTYFTLGTTGTGSAAAAISAIAQVIGTDAAGIKSIVSHSYANNSGYFAYAHQGAWEGTASVTSISITSSSGNLDAGTVYVYGA
jgi:hypothetical protein